MRKYFFWILIPLLLSACSLAGSGSNNTNKPEPKAITPLPSITEDPGMESSSGSSLVVWKRSGGIAGICQQMTLFVDGTYQILNCANDEIISEGTLDSASQDRMNELADMYTSLEWQTPQAELGADMFLDHFIFNGKGTLQADGKELNEEFAILAQILMRNQ